MSNFRQNPSHLRYGRWLGLGIAGAVASLLPTACEPVDPPAPSPSRELRRLIEQLIKQVQAGQAVSSEQVAEVRRACDVVKEAAVAGRGKGAMLDADTADRLARVERYVNEAYLLSQGSPDKPSDLRAAAAALEQARFSAPAE